MRLTHFQSELSKKHIDLGLIFSLDEEPNPNMEYLVGYNGVGLLVFPSGKEPFLLAPEMELERAQIAAKKAGIRARTAEKKKRLLETLRLLLSKETIKTIGIDESMVSVLLYKRLRKAFPGRYSDISGIAPRLRMVKDAKELSYLRKACQVTDLVYKKITSNFRFKTEDDVRRFMLEEYERNGCEPSFPPIVASHKNASQPHYDKSGPIGKGFLLMDFGAKYKGYHADMTRMCYLGKPSKEELADYQLVLDALLKSEAGALTKKKFADLYAITIDVLGKKSEFFTHSLGHGVGLQIHEPPSLSAEDKTLIQDSVAFTVEPGIYFPGRYGIRIEDTLVLRNGRMEIMTKSSKELKILKAR